MSSITTEEEKKNIAHSQAADDDDDDEPPTLVSAKIPVVILTGFLGSGKTTLLHYILTEHHKLKIAVVVNEFEFGKSIEKGLTVKSSEKSDDEWVELNNGCMCCSAKNQSVSALENMVAKNGSMDLILIETSGMADPQPVAAMFWQDEVLCGSLYLSGIVTVVDSKNIVSYLHSDKFPEASRQIMISDKLIFNKMDLVDEERKKQAVDAVTALNDCAEKKFTSFSRIDDLKSVLFIDTTKNAQDLAKMLPHADNQHAHSKMGSLPIEISLNAREEKEKQGMLMIASPHEIDLLCKDILYHEGKEQFEIVRAKAAIWTGTSIKDAKLFQLQAIGDLFDVVPMAAVTVPYGASRFLFVGKELDEDRLREIILSHFKHVVE